LREPAVAIGLQAVIVAVTEEQPRILTVALPAPPPAAAGAPAARAAVALPFGPLDPRGDRTLELGLRRWVREQTGLELGYVEQLYTFGDRGREPAERGGDARVISVAYLALVREERPLVETGARWLPWYRFLPWEDWREGRPPVLADAIVPTLDGWIGSSPDAAVGGARRERVDIAFGLGGAPWDGERVLERYELLYEAGFPPEAERDRRRSGPAADAVRLLAAGGPPARRRGRSTAAPPASAASAGPGLLPGEPMALDHRRILSTALGRLRGKLRYRPVVFELLPPTFTLFKLQRVVEALAGVRIHKGNFRRLVERGGLVEGTGRLEARTGGRPAELFRFRREVLRERPAPGVGLPGMRA
jgi:hypothetical protein